MSAVKVASVVSENEPLKLVEVPVIELTPEEMKRRDDAWRKEIDGALGEATEARINAMPKLPDVLGDYRQIEGHPGFYMRPMCIEVEIRALELFEQLSDGTTGGIMRVGLGVAASVIFSVDMPMIEVAGKKVIDKDAAIARILSYTQGDIEEEDLFVPVTPKQVGRMFKSTMDLKEKVLDPMGIKGLGLPGQAEDEEDPNASLPTGAE